MFSDYTWRKNENVGLKTQTSEYRGSPYESLEKLFENISPATFIDKFSLFILPANARAATPSPTAIKLLAYEGKNDYITYGLTH